jgi:hypothetical protein
LPAVNVQLARSLAARIIFNERQDGCGGKLFGHGTYTIPNPLLTSVNHCAVIAKTSRNDNPTAESDAERKRRHLMRSLEISDALQRSVRLGIIPCESIRVIQTCSIRSTLTNARGALKRTLSIGVRVRWPPVPVQDHAARR